MADEIVTIKIRINANTREIKEVNRELTRMGATARMVDATSSRLSKTIDQKLDPAMKRYRKAIGGLTSALATFNKLMLKVFGIGFVVAAAALASVNALFATGRFLVQAYRVTMQALAVSVVAVGAGLATVAAAMREYNAALYAYSYKAAPAMEGGLNKSRAALRMLQADAKLSVFGMEALNASFATLSRSGKVTSSTVKSMRTLADFAAAGGDPTKNLQAASEFVAMMQKNGKLTEEAIQLGSQVSDSFAKTLEEAKTKGIKTFDELMKAIENGSLKSANAVKGQADLLGTTIFGQFKSFFVQIQTLGADIGQEMLGPVSEALDKIFKIIRTTIVRLAPDIQAFGKGTLLEGLVSATQKLADFFVTLTRKYLPQSQGMLGRFRDFWDKTVYVFERMAASMKPLLDGGRAVIKIFGPAIKGIFGGFGTFIEKIDELIVKNRGKWDDFGKSLKNAVDLLRDLLIYMLDMFDRALPMITSIINAVTQLARAFMAVGRAISVAFGFLGAGTGGIASIAAMIPFIMAGMGIKNWSKGKNSGGSRGAGGFTNVFFGGGGGGGDYLSRGIGGKISDYRQARGLGYSRRDAYQLGFAPVSRSLGSVRPGGALAASLGLGLMLPFVDEKAAGFVGAGSMLAGLTPMMGRFGMKGLGAAGAIAGLGTMWNAQTAGGGAMSGLLGGASAGSMFGLPGMAVGAVAGALVGFFKGRGNKRKKEVTKAVQESSGELYNAMANAMVTGSIGNAKRIRERELARLEDKAYTEEEIKLRAKHRSAFNKEMKTRKETLEILEGPLQRFSDITATISRMTGKSVTEIQKLASELGVNLYDDTKDAVSVMRELGVAMAMTTEQIKQGIYDLSVSVLGVFDKAIQKEQATTLIDDIVESLKQGVSGGTFDKESAIQAVRDLTEAQLMAYEDMPVAMLTDIVNKFGALGSAYQTGGMFAGMSEANIKEFQGYIQPVLNEVLAEIRGTVIPGIGEMASKIFGDRGFELSSQFVSSKILSLRPEQFTTAERIMIQSGAYANLDNETRRRLAGQGLATNQVDFITQEFQRQLGIELPQKLMDVGTRIDELSEKEASVREEFFNVVTSAFADAPGWMTSTPPWWEEITGLPGVQNSQPWVTGTSKTPGVDKPNELIKTGGGPQDTTTSRLARTLSRHSFLNGMIPGSRTITSSFRTNNLGSINSDHVTGNAYDLIGQNLGAYARLVNTSGGFAEFHGAGGGRHLHVVPGSGPVGDTTMPSMTASTPLPSASTTNNFSIVVNGGSDSPERIARTVMNEIVRQQRSARERR